MQKDRIKRVQNERYVQSVDATAISQIFEDQTIQRIGERRTGNLLELAPKSHKAR